MFIEFQPVSMPVSCLAIYAKLRIFPPLDLLEPGCCALPRGLRSRHIHATYTAHTGHRQVMSGNECTCVCTSMESDTGDSWGRTPP